LLDQFYEEGKQKEAIRAAALLRKSNELLQKVEAHYREVGGIKGLEALRNQWKEFHDNAKLEFDLEQWQAKKKGRHQDTKSAGISE